MTIELSVAGRACAVVGVWVASGLSAMAGDCSAARTAYHNLPTLNSAAGYIECLEGAGSSSGGGGTAGVTWVPQNPLIGTGPRPSQPTYHELENYLRWLQDAYGISDQDWTTAMQAVRVAPDHDVLVNENVIVIPRNDLPAISPAEDINAIELERARPGYLDGLQLEQFQNFDMGSFQ